MKVLYCRNVWWPFGSHLTHMMHRKMYADMHGYKLLYTWNRHPAYSVTQYRISELFPTMSDISDAEIIDFADKNYSHATNRDNFLLEFTDEKEFIKSTKICYVEDISKTKWHEYKPDSFNTIDEYRSSVMKKLAEPSIKIKDYLNNLTFIREVSKLNGNYIAVHIRWTDKVEGWAAEADFYDVDVYFKHALSLREKYDTNNIVLNCDNTDAVAKFIEYNNNNQLKFNIIYDKEESRPKNDWKECMYQKWIANEKVSDKEYSNDLLNGFKIYKVIFEADSVVCNLFSNMALSPCIARNNKKDINISNKTPFPLFPACFWPKDTFSENVMKKRHENKRPERKP